MKTNRIYLFFALSMFFISLHAERQEVIGRSFMFTRPAYYNLAMYQQVSHNILLKKPGELGAGIHAIAFYQRSKPLSKTARYFLINCKNILLVSGDANVGDTYTRDVRANWLNLPNNFRGYMSVMPRQRQAGFLLEYNQDLCKICGDFTFLGNSWISIIVPCVWVENNIHLQQGEVVNPGSPLEGPVDIIAAFRQKSWCYSKMVGKRTRFHPAEVKVTLGQTYHAEDNFEFAYYSNLTFPTGNKPCARIMFDPVVGNAKHVGIGGGVNLQWVFNRDPATLAWCMFVNLEGIFLIRNNQHRTFDLKDKPWSRFMQYNIKNGPPNQNIPGVNVLTREVVVRPYGMFDFSTGFRLKTEHMELECGYNIWGHDHEHVHFREPFVNPCRPLYGIAGVGALNPSAPPDQQIAASASQSTIGLLTPNDVDILGNPVFVAIKEEDIDLASGSAGSTLNHKLHIAYGYVYKSDWLGYVFGAGYFVEFPQKNSALRNWGAWLKGAVTF